MAQFGEDAVSDLKYDFTKWLKEKKYDLKGVIEEPSFEQVNAFQLAQREIFAEEIAALEKQRKVKTGELSREDMVTIATTISKEKLEAKQHDIFAAVSAVCSAHPSAETLVALPFRVAQAFNGWLTGQITNPEA